MINATLLSRLLSGLCDYAMLAVQYREITVGEKEG